MLVRLVIYLAIAMMILAGGSTISSRSMETSISDKTLTSQTAMLDNAILKYYATHAELPAALSSDFLDLMGLYNIETANFAYSNNSDSYILRTKYATGIKDSPYSNQILPEISDNLPAIGEQGKRDEDVIDTDPIPPISGGSGDHGMHSGGSVN